MRWNYGRPPTNVLISRKRTGRLALVGIFLRHGSNIWLALGLAALVICFVAGVLPFHLLWVAIGALTFYLSEYGFHRFAFHAEPSRFVFVRKLQHRLHYDHHTEPDRLDLLFLPVWFLIPNLAVTALVFALLFGSSVTGSAMFGVVLAIFHYEWVHYVAHIPYQPRTALGRWIKQPPLYQREILVRGQQPVDGFCRRHLQASPRGRAQRHHPQALRLEQGREKWNPAFRKDPAPPKILEPDNAVALSTSSFLANPVANFRDRALSAARVVRGARGFEHAETSWIIRYRSMARRWRGPGHCPSSASWPRSRSARCCFRKSSTRITARSRWHGRC
jgi:4-hydroxysphinganine ceramide fatty acyl 2-hydroxylase